MAFDILEKKNRYLGIYKMNFDNQRDSFLCCCVWYGIQSTIFHLREEERSIKIKILKIIISLIYSI